MHYYTGEDKDGRFMQTLNTNMNESSKRCPNSKLSVEYAKFSWKLSFHVGQPESLLYISRAHNFFNK